MEQRILESARVPIGTLNDTLKSGRGCGSSARHLAIDLEVDPSENMSFSWSGILLSVDLQIEESPKNTNPEETPLIGERKEDSRNCHNEKGNTPNVDVPQHDTESTEDSFLQNNPNQKDSDNQPSPVEIFATSAELDTNWTHCPWPDWGEPLPPEESDVDMDVDFTALEKHSGLKKVVTFSDAVTFVEARNLQEEREASSFSYLGSSDDELEQGTDQVTSSTEGDPNDISPSQGKEILNSADVSAARHLLELCNIPDNVDSGGKDVETSEVSVSGARGRGMCEGYDPTDDLEKLSGLVEKIYAALPQLSILSSRHGKDPSEDMGTWTIEVSKDSGKFRMKRIKREKEGGIDGVQDIDDDTEVLDRPPWKRQYRSLSAL